MDLLFQIHLFVFVPTKITGENTIKNPLIFILGIIILVVAVILDYLGLNTKEGFSLVQIDDAALGLILILFGLVKMVKKTKKEA